MYANMINTVHGNRVLSAWITGNNPNMLETLLADDTFNLFTVDLEHTAVSIADLEDIARLVIAYKKQFFVRVSNVNDDQVSRYLDIGASGLVVPRVERADQIKHICQRSFYPPRGRRGVGLYRANGHGRTFENYFKNSHQISIIPQIETVEGVNNVNDILSQDGVNGFFVGPYDLSCSLGCPGDFENDKFKLTIRNLLEKIPETLQYRGIHIVHPSSDEIKKYEELNFNFLALSTDQLMFMEGLTLIKGCLKNA